MEDFIRQMEDVLELDEGSIQESTRLEDINWDSLAALSAIVMLQEDYDKVVNNDDFAGIETIGDIYKKFVA